MTLLETIFLFSAFVFIAFAILISVFKRLNRFHHVLQVIIICGAGAINNEFFMLAEHGENDFVSFKNSHYSPEIQTISLVLFIIYLFTTLFYIINNHRR